MEEVIGDFDEMDTPFEEELQLSTLVSIKKIPEQFRNVFLNYSYFNRIQSEAFPTVYQSDDSVVVSAPTGSGKTVMFELAILRLLSTSNFSENNYKIVYVAPMKAICEERLLDWHKRFASVGISCISVTGDSDYNSISHILNHNLIITTPEKWDSLTRRWRYNKKIVDKVALFMIDEVHLLNDEARGATLEAIVSRMKTIQDFNDMNLGKDVSHKIRFVAVSATIPNVEDIAEWLGTRKRPAKYFNFDDETRPVKLTKIVQGFYYNPKASTPFKFDIMLSYKLQNVILTYAKGKPILIFCSTRKSVELTSKYLTQNLSIRLSPEQLDILKNEASKISDQHVRENLISGVGSHHAGLLPEHRRIVEELFRRGDLPVLVTTSTLSMGVNLPAHLVIIKSTKMYFAGEYKDYTETTLLQMIGRAGRPQFDTEGIAVILTTCEDKKKYEDMVGRLEPIESSLHKHLTEHLNSEVVLGTITDLGIAMQWLTSTFLHIRARRHPKHYNISAGLLPDQIDKKLLDICQIEVNKLARVGMITIDETASLSPTDVGTLMAKYCVHFETMKMFTQLTGHETLLQILCLISNCHEYSDLYLRVNDKKSLNLLNKCKNKETIRFPLTGKIKTLDMKINCIIQAVLGCLPILDSSLQNEAQRIMRIGERTTQCLMDYTKTKPKYYSALLSAITLAKCFQCKIWENSQHVSRQLTGIGSVMSTYLVAAGKTTFQLLLDANPRSLEVIIHRKCPMGDNIQTQIEHLPQYWLQLEEIKLSPTVSKVNCFIRLSNLERTKHKLSIPSECKMMLLIGDDDNNILKYEEFTHNFMIHNPEISMDLEREFTERIAIHGHFISENWAGIDCHSNINLLEPDCAKETNMAEEAPTVTKVIKPKPKPKINKDKTTPHVQKFISLYFNSIKKKQMQNEKKIETVELNQDNIDTLLDSEDFGDFDGFDLPEEKLLQSSGETKSENLPNANKINIQSNIVIAKAVDQSNQNLPSNEAVGTSVRTMPKFVPPFKKDVPKYIPDAKDLTVSTSTESKIPSEYNIDEENLSSSSSFDLQEEFDKEFNPMDNSASNNENLSIPANRQNEPIVMNEKQEFSPTDSFVSNKEHFKTLANRNTSQEFKPSDNTAPKETFTTSSNKNNVLIMINEQQEFSPTDSFVSNTDNFKISSNRSIVPMLNNTKQALNFTDNFVSNKETFIISANRNIVPIINNGKQEFRITIPNNATNTQSSNKILNSLDNLLGNKCGSTSSDESYFSKQTKSKQLPKKYHFKRLSSKSNLNANNLEKEKLAKKEFCNSQNKRVELNPIYPNRFSLNDTNDSFIISPKTPEIGQMKDNKNDSFKRNTLSDAGKNLRYTPKCDKKYEQNILARPKLQELRSNLSFASLQNHNVGQQSSSNASSISQHSNPSTSSFRNAFQNRLKSGIGSQMSALNRCLPNKSANNRQMRNLLETTSQPTSLSALPPRSGQKKWKMFHGPNKAAEFENCLLNSSPIKENMNIINTFSQQPKKKITHGPILDMTKILSANKPELDSTNDNISSNRMKHNLDLSDQQARIYKNEKKEVSWRSPIVTSPEMKHSPSIFKNIYSKPLTTKTESNPYKNHISIPSTSTMASFSKPTPFGSLTEQSKNFPLADRECSYSQRSIESKSSLYENYCNISKQLDNGSTDQQNKRIRLDNIGRYIIENSQKTKKVASKPHTIVSTSTSSPDNETDYLNQSAPISFEFENQSKENTFMQTECDFSGDLNNSFNFKENFWNDNDRTQPNVNSYDLMETDKHTIWNSNNADDLDSRYNLWEANSTQNVWIPDIRMRPDIIPPNQHSNLNAWEQFNDYNRMMYDRQFYNPRQYQPMNFNYDEINFNSAPRPVFHRRHQLHYPSEELSYNYEDDQQRK